MGWHPRSDWKPTAYRVRSACRIAAPMRATPSSPIVSLLLTGLLLAAVAPAQEPESLAVSGGVSNFNKSDRWFEAGVEYRHPLSVWKLAFAAGLYANSGPSGWIFAGLRRDFALGGGGAWVFTPGLALTAYSRGDGKDLGGVLEFRSSAELGYRWPGHKRLALGIYHMSNAGIYDRNPGMNSLIVTYSFPLR